eukprot:3842328-Rhodomonas_salina.1
MLSQYRTSHSSIRYTSTAHRTAPYASSVPYITQHHTLAQYHTLHGTIRYASTPHRIAHTKHHTLSQYRTAHSTIRYASTPHRTAPYAMPVPHIA